MPVHCTVRANAPTRQRANAPTRQRANAPTRQRANAPNLIKASSLALMLACSLLVLFLPLPSRAQYQQWFVQDQNGNPIPQNWGDGSYSLTGTITGSASNTYPEGLAQAAQSDPAYKGYWLSAYAPNVLTGGFLYRASPSNTATGAAVSVSGLAANAANDPNNWAHCGDDYDNGTFYVGNFNDWDFLDSPTEVSDYPAINGSINASVAGTLMAFWKYNPADPNAPPTPPPYIDLLLTTTLSATTYVTYNSGGYASGLSASASATDEVNGQGFNETATASAGDGATAGVPVVVGRHLVRAQVDPATGIAEVYVGGSATIAASNTVPAGVMYPYFPYVYYYPYYGPASATTGASVAATALIDNRDVTITSPTIEDSNAKDPITSQPVKNQRDPGTGQIVTDSVATLINRNGAEVWIGQANFVADTTGFQGDSLYDPPNLSYAWSSPSSTFSQPDSDANLTQSSANMGFYFGADDSPFPAFSVVRLDVHDNVNPADAANYFKVRWHEPYEAWADCQPEVQEEIDVIPPTSTPTNIPGGQVAYMNQTFLCTFQWGPYQIANGINKALGALPLAADYVSDKLLIFKTLLEAAGQPIDPALLGVTTSSNVVNTSNAFAEACYLTSINRSNLVPVDPDTNQTADQSHYRMIGAILSAHYTRKFLQADAYGVHGYLRPAITTTRTIIKVVGTGSYEYFNSVNP